MSGWDRCPPEDLAATRRFGALVRKHRVAAGLTQNDLGDRLGVSQPYVSNLEHGRACPPRGRVGAYARALRLSEPEAARLRWALETRP